MKHLNFSFYPGGKRGTPHGRRKQQAIMRRRGRAGQQLVCVADADVAGTGIHAKVPELGVGVEGSQLGERAEVCGKECSRAQGDQVLADCPSNPYAICTQHSNL